MFTDHLHICYIISILNIDLILYLSICLAKDESSLNQSLKDFSFNTLEFPLLIISPCSEKKKKHFEITQPGTEYPDYMSAL